jgi:hypothetical protein
MINLRAGFLAMAAVMFCSPPAIEAGLQAALIHTLTDAGLDPRTYGLTPQSRGIPPIDPTRPVPSETEKLPSFTWGFREVETPPDSAVLSAFVSYDLWIDTVDRWLGAQIRIELDEGTIFQQQIGGVDFTVGPPHEDLLELSPHLAFDSQIGLSEGEVFVAGGAVNLGGTPHPRVGETVFDVAWASAPGQVATGRFSLGRFTLSVDAAGRAAVLLSDGVIVTHLVNVEHGRLSVGDRFAHGLDEEFRPLPPPPPPPAPLVLTGAEVCFDATSGIVNCPVESSDHLEDASSGGVSAPEPSTGPIAGLLLLAFVLRRMMLRTA